jgi:hypothetical protein
MKKRVDPHGYIEEKNNENTSANQLQETAQASKPEKGGREEMRRLIEPL